MFKKKPNAAREHSAGVGNLVPIVQGLSRLLGQDYAVILYDLDDARQGRAISAVNAEAAGLSADGRAPAADQAAIDRLCRPGAAGPVEQVSTTAGERHLRSCLIRIDGADGRPTGILALHHDLATADLLQLLAVRLAGASDRPEPEEPAARATDVVEQRLERARLRLGKPFAYAGKAEKIQAVEWLDREGFFFFKGAVEALAREMGNTKYTIYAYLRETRMRSAD